MWLAVGIKGPKAEMEIQMSELVFILLQSVGPIHCYLFVSFIQNNGINMKKCCCLFDEF